MKNYVIIGGSSGIGAAIVDSLRNEPEIHVLASYWKHPKESAGNVEFFPFNVLDDQLTDQPMPDEVHGFVFCPGAIELKPFHRLTEASVLDDFKLQVLGAMKTIQAILPKMKASQNASIILFSTVAVQQGFNFHAQVSMSKGAIEGLTRSLAAEFAPTIRVNCIAPSLTDTPLAAKLLSSPEKFEANAARHPLKRIGSSLDHAELAVFLLSEKANWITGQIIHVDGGMSSIKL